jgi:DNA helicase INO80
VVLDRPTASLTAPLVLNTDARFCDNLELLQKAYVRLPKVVAPTIQHYCCDRSFAYQQDAIMHNALVKKTVFGSARDWDTPEERIQPFGNADVTIPGTYGGFLSEVPLISPMRSTTGFSTVHVPHFTGLIKDCGKMRVLDSLLMRLKKEGHRVLIYSQMTVMLDILEDFLAARGHKFVRLDGSSRLDERRDMVEQFQNEYVIFSLHLFLSGLIMLKNFLSTSTSIFVFLLSTRAGGLGINLTSADTVIFYDSDWNPTMDAQAMDRAHRLGQTRPVTVYRLITKNTVEEKILMRAQQKDKIQSIVVAGGKFEMDDSELWKANDALDVLLDQDEIETATGKKKRGRRALNLVSKKRSAKPMTSPAPGGGGAGPATLMPEAESIEPEPAQ